MCLILPKENINKFLGLSTRHGFLVLPTKNTGILLDKNESVGWH